MTRLLFILEGRQVILCVSVKFRLSHIFYVEDSLRQRIWQINTASLYINPDLRHSEIANSSQQCCLLSLHWRYIQTPFAFNLENRRGIEEKNWWKSQNAMCSFNPHSVGKILSVLTCYETNDQSVNVKVWCDFKSRLLIWLILGHSRRQQSRGFVFLWIL